MPSSHDDVNPWHATPPGSNGSPAAPESPQGPRFSSLVTALAALIVLAGIGGFVWLQLSVPRLDRIAQPEQALTLMVNRTMDLEEAIARAPAWERALYELTSGNRDYELVQSGQWLEELTLGGADPRTHMYAAVLQAEAGHLEESRSRIFEWQTRPEPFPTYARILNGAYLTPRLTKTDEVSLQAELAEAFPEDWFYDRLAINLAIAAGDVSLLKAREVAMLARGQPLLGRTRLFAVAEVAILVTGCVILVICGRVARKERAERLRAGEAGLPPPWGGRVALAVLLRGGALSVIVVAALLRLGVDDPLLRLALIPVSNLPIIVLAHRYLLAPAGLGLGSGLGLTLVPGSMRRLIGVTVAVLAMGLVGEWVIDQLAVSLGKASHWTEWFDPDLVWGDSSMLVLSLVEYVILAPFFEELIFRGLVFATLRRRLAWAPAALVSASIFAAAHGYGLLGFASVLWSGLIWAWAYEKTGSLLPGMAAHALNNLMVFLTVIALLRW